MSRGQRRQARVLGVDEQMGDVKIRDSKSRQLFQDYFMEFDLG